MGPGRHSAGSLGTRTGLAAPFAPFDDRSRHSKAFIGARSVLGMLRALRSHLLGGKKLTFLYVPDNASVRQFIVPKVFFYGLAGMAFLGLGLIAFFGSQYLSAAAEGRQLVGLRSENLQLQDKLEEMQG